MIYLAMILGFAAFLGFVIKRDKNGSVPALLLKTATSVLFMATAFTAVAVSGNATVPAMLVLTGLLLGLVGDVLLDLMFVYGKDRSVYLVSGMVSFSLGHVCYITAAILLFGTGIAALYGLLASAAVNVLIIVVGTKSGMLDFGKFLAPSYAYGTLLIGFFFTCVLSAMMAGSSTLAILLITGSFLFAVSDGILSMTYFGGRDSRAIIAANHAFYYAAQFIIAYSILAM